MKPYNPQIAIDYVSQHIDEFHQARLNSLEQLELKDVLMKKNPYMFRAKGILTAPELVQSLVDAFISSNEETIFGDWLEQLAIYINGQVYGGIKSGIPGIDLEFVKDNIRYIVSIKSGPKWANSGQKKGMIKDFVSAKKTLRTNHSGLTIIAVNGCCYGKDSKPDKGDYFKYCGQRFWEFISGDEDLYQKLIIPLGQNARQHNENFKIQLGGKVTRFITEFAEVFCYQDCTINWDKLVMFNSGKKRQTWKSLHQ
ncbi:MAG: hypothetical protein IKX40_10805 [Thermoguttaceae bacterium]|nr:hypothetical protein [Thermoguttaceae bacterium]